MADQSDGLMEAPSNELEELGRCWNGDYTEVVVDCELDWIQQRIAELSVPTQPEDEVDPDEFVELMKAGLDWMLKQLAPSDFEDVGQHAAALVATLWAEVARRLLDMEDMPIIVRRHIRELNTIARQVERERWLRLCESFRSLKQWLQ